MGDHAGKAIGVICVDDNDLLAQSLERLMRTEPGFTWLGRIADGELALGAVLAARPDVVLMDIDMPGFDTFHLVEALAAKAPDSRVVMFSGHVDRDYLNRALDCGAWGYLSKGDDLPALLDGIRRVHAGQIALGREVIALQRAHDRPTAG